MFKSVRHHFHTRTETLHRLNSPALSQINKIKEPKMEHTEAFMVEMKSGAKVPWSPEENRRAGSLEGR